MSIELSGIVIRSPRRLRLVFTNLLAGGAFGLSPTLYVITPVSALAGTPSVKAALIVPSAPTNVELALDQDLLPDAIYQLSAVGVPALDSSVSTGASVQNFHQGLPQDQVNVEVYVDDRGLILYGADIIWNGDDWVETVNGDLDRVQGVDNAVAAVRFRALSSGLPWDPTFGANPRLYVDEPVPAAGNLRTAFMVQAVRDPRVKSVSVDVSTDDDQVTYAIKPVLIGGETPEPVSVAVNVP